MSESTSAVDVQAALKGVDYPVSRAHLIEHAAGKGAPEKVLDALRDLPQRDYSDAADVSQALKGL